MRKVLLLLLAVLLLGACSKYKYEEVKDDPMKTRIYTLKNGLKVYLSVNEEKPRIQTYIVVRTGSKNDPAETTGLAHYLEHLMFKGTSKFGVTDPEAEAPLLADIEARYEKYRLLTDPDQRRQAYREIDSVSQLAAKYFIPNEYDKIMAVIGAEGTNANTWHDRTCYVEDIPSNQIETWLKIEADRFKNMTIRGFHTELEAVYEEYNIYLAEDGQKVYDAMMQKLFPSHPYGMQTTIGTQEHLKNPSITNIKNYFAKWYVPNNTAICMAGDFDPDEVIAQIDKYFGDWQPAPVTDGEPSSLVPQPSFPDQPELTSVVDTTVIGQEAEQLVLGWRFDKASSAQADTLQVIDFMLTNGKAGLIDLDINQQMKMLRAYSTRELLMDYSTFWMAGHPREGQTLDEVRQLLLAELDKLKKGDFSDDLLPSVINNMKLEAYEAMENNEERADMFLDAFVNNIPWERQVRLLDRISGMTKQQIVDFARRHFRDNYVAVYKRQGIDPNQKKIDKPEITPIPTNRDTTSQFVQDIQKTEVKPIEPHFVNFQRDLTFSTIGMDNGLPLVYVKNEENGRFVLNFRYDFGEDADVRYFYAANYLDYLGTDSLSAEQIRQQFYKLACTYYVNVEARHITVGLSGLSENMPEAVCLLEHLLQHAKVDENAYKQYIAVLGKERADSKFSQQHNFAALRRYGIYGPYNGWRNILTTQQLAAINPQQLLDLLKGLIRYEHTLLYYGPMSEQQLGDALALHSQLLPTLLLKTPVGKHYTMQPTPQNEILIAPYDAKNIYMQMYHIKPQQWRADEAGVCAVFNEYYGGSMGSVVFQEIREARGLAYSAYAGYMTPDYADESGCGLVSIITQNDKMMDCIRQFHQILDTIPQNESSFQVAKEAVRKKIASQRITKFGLISAWLAAKQRGIDYDERERIYEQLPSVTLQDVVRFEQQQMAFKPYRYVILGDERELDMKALQQIAPIRRLTTEEIFGY
ncbi:MAG: insulinase family protein [Prevotella sp.]|nr:insulinase family protein [Prevotella sp.]